MATKTIKTNVTIHVPTTHHVPFTFDANGAVTGGKYDVEKIPPGTAVTLDAEEADAIIDRHGGEEVKGPIDESRLVKQASGASAPLVTKTPSSPK